ncbi:hypothetical protein [Paracoccus pantotrophus]|uniref:hypothetical protein n=1 Tax=Paracoccus pantotrophus TaxID=82367 RepID=UPI0012DFB7C7|nr:hypothetical protein [Paracoccus pantotrophus]
MIAGKRIEKHISDAQGLHGHHGPAAADLNGDVFCKHGCLRFRIAFADLFPSGRGPPRRVARRPEAMRARRRNRFAP